MPPRLPKPDNKQWGSPIGGGKNIHLRTRLAQCRDIDVADFSLDCYCADARRGHGCVLLAEAENRGAQIKQCQ